MSDKGTPQFNVFYGTSNGDKFLILRIGEGFFKQLDVECMELSIRIGDFIVLFQTNL